jgi:DNA-binding NtrC family response regulator
MSKSLVLIVEDDPDGARSVAEAVADAGFEPVVATRAEEGMALFLQQRPAVLLTDLVLPDFDGVELMLRARRVDPQVPVLVMTAYGTVADSVRAMQAGAYDFLTKPLDLDELQAKLRRAAEASRLRHQVEQLARVAGSVAGASSMVAASPGMRRVLEQVAAVADTQATVLVEGESGTGKELVARALHADSRRTAGPFVAVNCGAFAESLLESELFGHEKGAFTGATAQHKGAFERADGGTLFLDEIGDAPTPVQVKLLRALEEREIRRIGGQAAFKVDVRFVFATNRDLEGMVADGSFREDLLYRVNVVSIRIPPLRERREDIRPLAERFIVEACERHGRRIGSVAPGFYERLEQFDWPGNIRQLRNVVESAVLLTPTPELRVDGLRIGAREGPASAVPTDSGEGVRPFVVPEGMTLEQIEREVLVQMLARHEGNRTLTAEKLGLSRRTIQRKIQEHGLPF